MRGYGNNRPPRSSVHSYSGFIRAAKILAIYYDKQYSRAFLVVLELGMRLQQQENEGTRGGEGGHGGQASRRRKIGW